MPPRGFCKRGVLGRQSGSRGFLNRELREISSILCLELPGKITCGLENPVICVHVHLSRTHLFKYLYSGSEMLCLFNNVSRNLQRAHENLASIVLIVKEIISRLF